MKKIDVVQSGNNKSGAAPQEKTSQEQQCKEGQHLFRQRHRPEKCGDGDN